MARYQSRASADLVQLERLPRVVHPDTPHLFVNLSSIFHRPLTHTSPAHARVLYSDAPHSFLALSSPFPHPFAPSFVAHPFT